jgi:PAS domain S-box-containing protein
LFTRSLRAQDGSVARSLSVMVDVTKEKRFEAAFRESEEKFQQAFESAGHGIALLDPAGTWIQSNRELRQMLGFEEGDPPRGDFLAHADSSNVRTIRTEVSHLIKGASDSFQLETELVRADDRRIPVMLGFGVVRDPEGNATYLVCHVTDLTELKTAEARFLQAQKMEAVGNLTGGIAHDFNNLLAVILGNLQLLKRRVKDQDDIGGFIEDAIGATRRGADLTRQLLAFSRRQTLEPKPVRVNDMLADMEKLLARTLGTHIEIALRLASDLPVAQVDPSQLESAILNLAINARDAMPDGGHLTISSSEAVISKSDAERLPEVRPGRYVCITISDTGHGMSPEILERVFEPFFTTKPTGKGTGLGLSMVYGFIKQSGGHVNAYSEENEGTRFTMYLPVTEDSPATPAEDIGTQSLPGGSETVLLVDDEPEFLKVAAAILEDLGYTVLTAPDGPSALAGLKKEPKVDLLITDMVMPGGMNGHQLADQARELRPDLPVLLASGFPRDSFANGRRYPLIQKPYLEDALARKVRKVLEAPVPVSNGKDPDSA